MNAEPEEATVEVRCPFIDMMRDYFPIVPFVIPLLPMLLVLGCLWMYLHRISASVERQEALLDEILNAVRRNS